MAQVQSALTTEQVFPGAEHLALDFAQQGEEAISLLANVVGYHRSGLIAAEFSQG